MPQFGGKSKVDSKRHFTVVMDGKEHGLYVSSTPSSAARKAVTKLCTANKSKKVEFHIREITQGSKKKTYGPYIGFIEKLKEPIELKGRVIRYKPVAKLSEKKGVQKGGQKGGGVYLIVKENSVDSGKNGEIAKLICKAVKENLLSTNSSLNGMNIFSEIEDLDGGKALKIKINADKENYDKLLKQTIHQLIEKFSIKIHQEKGLMFQRVVSVNIYKNNTNGSVNKWNAETLNWKKNE